MKREERLNDKGQVTLFIILGIIIIVLGVLIYLFYPGIFSGAGGEDVNPNLFMQSCVEEEFENAVVDLSNKGGSFNPRHYIMYEDETIEYLCYTSEYYKTCVMQQPMLKKHVEEEIENELKNTVEQCFKDLEDSYDSKGYEVSLKQGGYSVELLPGKVQMNLNSSLTLSKDSSKRYESLRVYLDNNIYELVNIANSILNWEARYGDAETTTYMNYYKDVKVEKKKQSDGSTVYILTDRNTGYKFQFAVRSIAWPGGYGDNILNTE
jgi:hypothetical protein